MTEEKGCVIAICTFVGGNPTIYPYKIPLGMLSSIKKHDYAIVVINDIPKVVRVQEIRESIYADHTEERMPLLCRINMTQHFKSKLQHQRKVELLGMMKRRAQNSVPLHIYEIIAENDTEMAEALSEYKKLMCQDA